MGKTLVLLGAVGFAAAFQGSGRRLAGRRVLQTPSSALSPLCVSAPDQQGDTEEAVGTPIMITGNNFELTDPLKSHVDEALAAPLAKIGSLEVSTVDVHLSVLKHHQPAKLSRAEVTVFAAGDVIRRAEEADDMYQAVDAMAHSLGRALSKLKSRRSRSGTQATFARSALDGEEYANLDEPVDEWVDDFEITQPKITKMKSFDLKRPVSIEEASFSLDYVDHDFYVFRNEETNEINVIYKRHGDRGLGLIQPGDD